MNQRLLETKGRYKRWFLPVILPTSRPGRYRSFV